MYLSRVFFRLFLLKITSQTQPVPEQILPGKLARRVFLCRERKRTSLTLPRKHPSLQEFERVAKQAKVNGTRIIIKKIKSVRSSSDRPETNDPTETLQELEDQLTARKVCLV